MIIMAGRQVLDAVIKVYAPVGRMKETKLSLEGMYTRIENEFVCLGSWEGATEWPGDVGTGKEI